LYAPPMLVHAFVTHAPEYVEVRIDGALLELAYRRARELVRLTTMSRRVPMPAASDPSTNGLAGDRNSAQPGAPDSPALQLRPNNPEVLQ
jgi:hypothetical protein